MKSKDELKEIAFNISEQVKLFVRSHGMVKTFIEGKRINKEAIEMYGILRDGYELTDEENRKVDKMFSRMMILGARKSWKDRKKVTENE